ncbi:MAG: glutaminase A, partial [Cellvibrionales bacterium]|nr:glutaminase A [Cellvibrionales bacterium]
MDNYSHQITAVADQIRSNPPMGKVANYIPGLERTPPDLFGISLMTLDETPVSAGDAQTPFSLQSISKVFSLTLALKTIGEELWERVGVEPSGNAFNSLIQLEVERGKPRNPFINAGALVICDVLISTLDHPKQHLLEFVRFLACSDELCYNQSIAESEKNSSYRNAALVSLMKDFDNIKNPTEKVLDLYCYLCSLEMCCESLAHTFLFLANQGMHPRSNEQVISPSQTKRINAIMQLCGFYDEAGEFAYRVGLPGKSGVG